MDAELLHHRLVAAEGALIKLDGRIDGLAAPAAEALSAHDARLMTLEESLTQCIARLEQLETPTSSEPIAMAAAVAAMAEAETARAEADEALAEAVAESEPEPEALEEPLVEEISPEPESESEAGLEKQSRSNWLENLFVLR